MKIKMSNTNNIVLFNHNWLKNVSLNVRLIFKLGVNTTFRNYIVFISLHSNKFNNQP